MGGFITYAGGMRKFRRDIYRLLDLTVQKDAASFFCLARLKLDLGSDKERTTAAQHGEPALRGRKEVRQHVLDAIETNAESHQVGDHHQ